ncbi:unnamed protein product [Brassica oleracea]|uniref:(rape) hypothetical protein n=1 Tax=Brassica napus TaxID=3708 RepID=A0A816U447_BRANA|nr:unnamed protein product [Brassica napus]
MGKGGMSQGEGSKVEEENMSAWLVGPHDVRVRMKAVGICGSDVHYLKTMRCADFIGHECAGVIEEVRR